MEYTVIARYYDNEQRYATTVEANSPGEAEELAQEQARIDNPNTYSADDDPLDIAGVIEGKVKVVG